MKITADVMSQFPARFVALTLLALSAVGCGAPSAAEYPPVSGRRVQGTTVIAKGAVPYQLATYELLFAEQPGASRHARRAALHVDLVGGQGRVQGFTEWGRPGETPMTYLVGGWAHQRTVEGEPLTVFELALNYLQPVGAGPARTPEDPRDLTVHVVVNEASGDVTLMRRR